MKTQIKPNSFAYCSAHGGIGMASLYARYFENIYQKRIEGENHFKELIASNWLPEIIVMINFSLHRTAIVSLCLQNNINIVYTEDGFFPRYATIHVDPLGFCWESSLTRLVFRNLNPEHRMQAQTKRREWLTFKKEELPSNVKRPFVLWPLQLIGDKVNQWGLNVSSWDDLIQHFRSCLPLEYQLVIKEHPLAKNINNSWKAKWEQELPNTVFISKNVRLKDLLAESSAVAGANSTVMYEARLMFHKPVYTYAQSWHTNHNELFMPIPYVPSISLPRFDYVENNNNMRTDRLNEYTDWFLAQLLIRQIDKKLMTADRGELKRKILRYSYDSYIKNGDQIFFDK